MKLLNLVFNLGYVVFSIVKGVLTGLAVGIVGGTGIGLFLTGLVAAYGLLMGYPDNSRICQAVQSGTRTSLDRVLMPVAGYACSSKEL